MGSFISFEDETFVRGEGCNGQEIHHKLRMGFGSSQSKITPNFDPEEVRSIGIPTIDENLENQFSFSK